MMEGVTDPLARALPVASLESAEDALTPSLLLRYISFRQSGLKRMSSFTLHYHCKAAGSQQAYN